MSILEMYKFIQEEASEVHFSESEKDIICFFSLFQFESVTEKFKEFLDDLDEGLFKVEMRKDYFIIELKDICEFYEIDLEELARELKA